MQMAMAGLIPSPVTGSSTGMQRAYAADMTTDSMCDGCTNGAKPFWHLATAQGSHLAQTRITPTHVKKELNWLNAANLMH